MRRLPRRHDVAKDLHGLRMSEQARQERYHSTPEIHAAEIARSWKNKQVRKLRRRLQVAVAVVG